MARGFLQLSCLLLATATAAARDRPRLKKLNATQLTELKNTSAVPKKYLSGYSIGAVVAHLAEELQITKSQLQEELQSTQAELLAIKKKLQTTQADSLAFKNLKTDQGSTFVRWGRNSCPANTSLVYSGYAAGRYYSHRGSGANRLCVISTPQYDDTSRPRHFAALYGAEYDGIPGHRDQDVPCSVCLAAQSTTIMVAGTLTCPRGWTSQYTGHLTAEEDNEEHVSSEYVCLDNNPENIIGGGSRDSGGLLFFYVVTSCGSLPCPPYIDYKVITCVVCSK